MVGVCFGGCSELKAQFCAFNLAAFLLPSGAPRWRCANSIANADFSHWENRFPRGTDSSEGRPREFIAALERSGRLLLLAEKSVDQCDRLSMCADAARAPRGLRREQRDDRSRMRSQDFGDVADRQSVAEQLNGELACLGGVHHGRASYSGPREFFRIRKFRVQFVCSDGKKTLPLATQALARGYRSEP